MFSKSCTDSAVIISSATVKSGDLKKIQDNEIKLKTKNIFNILHALLLTVVFWVVRNTCVKAKAKPCNNPQIMKVHPAPCQIPPITIVIIKFLTVFDAPTRLPPRGKNK